MDLFGLDPRLPVTASECIKIGIAGNCGVECTEFVSGRCDEPQEISKAEVTDNYCDEEAIAIFKLYDCFKPVTQK
tara:strand:+ start:331 stop:555 length:225 start_codon:yes stop_codon:yes gene_type:complete